MIVVRVQFPVKVSNKDEFIKKMAATTPKYEGMEGLTRKYYVMNDEGNQAGGIYLWETRAQAEAWYNAEWVKYMTEAWGEAPLLEYMDCPIVVDNDTDKVITKNAA